MFEILSMGIGYFFILSSQIVNLTAANPEPAIEQNELTMKYDDFAGCISDSGISFYGAHWCAACEQQKSLFGQAKYLLPYIECYENESLELSSSCAEKNIESFPTWITKSGDRFTGTQSFEQLSELTGCELPS